MRVALIITDAAFYAHTGYAEAWVAALEAEGAAVDRLAGPDPAWLRDGVPAGAYDVAIPHVLIEEALVFGGSLQAAVALEQAGVPLTNSVGSLLASGDKRLTHAAWARAGLPQPRTWDLRTLTGWPAPGEPLLVKPALGDAAKDIAVVRDLAEARAAVPDEPAVLQEWIREPACVRIYATPDEASLAYEKARDPGRLVTHGTVYPRRYEPPPAMAELARGMVAGLGGGLMGVDVLVDAEGGYRALEANAPFGFDVTDPEQGAFVARAALARAGAPTPKGDRDSFL